MKIAIPLAFAFLGVFLFGIVIGSQHAKTELRYIEPPDSWIIDAGIDPSFQRGPSDESMEALEGHHH